MSRVLARHIQIDFRGAFWVMRVEDLAIYIPIFIIFFLNATQRVVFSPSLVKELGFSHLWLWWSNVPLHQRREFLRGIFTK